MKYNTPALRSCESAVTVRRMLIAILLFALMSSRVCAQAYYVDANGGNDSLDGRTPMTAWQSLSRVNGTTFLPGDTIYFTAGGIWNGQLKPKGSGVDGNPIVIDMLGGGGKPLIVGGGVTGQGVLYLYNQEYWEINNLEITNDALTAGDRRGVLVAAGNFGTVHHIHLKNLDIHHVKGIVGQNDAEKRTAGIGIETTNDASVATRYDDVLIEGCTIHHVENTGLYTDNLSRRNDYPGTSGWERRRFTNVRIRNNVIHDIAKNAMIVRLFDKGIIEHNVCYETAQQLTGNTMFTVSCDSTVFQFNEGYLNRSPDNDGSMYDADLRSPNTVWQYSYSHDNSHGLIWFCTVAEDTGIVVRYNVSQNDRGRLVAFRYDFSGATVHNNVFYIDSSLSPEIIHEKSGGVQTYRYCNNIVYNNSPTAVYTWGSANRTIDHNLFYGIHPAGEPADPFKITDDPGFVNPGTGGIGIGTVNGYQLKEGSPCIDSGVELPGHCPEDFLGNPVPHGSGIDRGAFEFQSGPSGIEDDRIAVPVRLGLQQNFPNPFNPATSIRYEVPVAGRITLKVYDILGREVASLLDGVTPAGTYAVDWNASELPTGVYFCALTAVQGINVKRMLLIR